MSDQRKATLVNSLYLLRTVALGIRYSWKALVLADIACKIIVFVVLTPIVGVLFRIFIAVSGRSILADQDIMLFFLGPLGWICFREGFIQGWPLMKFIWAMDKLGLGEISIDWLFDVGTNRK